MNAKRWATPSALFRASCDGDVEALKALIHNGVNVNAVNEVKHTALHHAAQNGHVDVAKVLIQNGADVNANQKAGWTPLFYTVHHDFFRFRMINEQPYHVKKTSKPTYHKNEM